MQKRAKAFLLFSLCIITILAVVIGPRVIATTGDVCGKKIVMGGTYYLTQDCATDRGRLIYVAARDVTIDLSGYTLRCQPLPAKQIGIYAMKLIKQDGLSIRNGHISQCYMGINASRTDRVTIENVTFEDNSYIGTHLGGRGNIVRNNSFIHVGGAIRGTDPKAKQYGIAINNPGDDCLIENNKINDLYPRNPEDPKRVIEGVGILVGAGHTGCVLQGNSIANAEYKRRGYGIWIADNASASIVHNSIIDMHYAMVGTKLADVDVHDNNVLTRKGITDTHGIYIGKGRVYNNHVNGPEYPFQGVAKAEDNSHKP